MFIYNVTTKINRSIQEEWLEWMLKEHMPALIATNCFTHFQLLKIHEQDETEELTYVAQYFTKSKTDYNRYLELYAQKLRKDTLATWGDNFVAFRTLLEVVY